VSSWSFVVIAADPVRQQAAAAYLSWVSDPARLAQWAEAARLVPASKSAFAQAIHPREYADVLWSLLQHAMVAPPLAAQAPYTSAWHSAVAAVLGGQLGPEDAAFRAIQAITQ